MYAYLWHRRRPLRQFDALSKESKSEAKFRNIFVWYVTLWSATSLLTVSRILQTPSSGQKKFNLHLLWYLPQYNLVEVTATSDDSSISTIQVSEFIYSENFQSIYQTTWCYIPEDIRLYRYSCKNLNTKFRKPETMVRIGLQHQRGTSVWCGDIQHKVTNLESEHDYETRL